MGINLEFPGKGTVGRAPSESLHSQPLSPAVGLSRLFREAGEGCSQFSSGIQGGCGMFFIIEFALPSKPIFSEVHLQASPAPFQPPSLPF